jgi:hypothetical protein
MKTNNEIELEINNYIADQALKLQINELKKELLCFKI